MDGKSLEDTSFNLDLLRTREDRQRGYLLETVVQAPAVAVEEPKVDHPAAEVGEPEVDHPEVEADAAIADREVVGQENPELDSSSLSARTGNVRKDDDRMDVDE